MKINLFVDDLVDIYSEKTGCDREKSQILIKEFFLLIEEALVRDRYVKIKSFGTFKFIESVNAEGKKEQDILFIPEKEFADAVNEPFAFFEPVVVAEEDVAGSADASRDMPEPAEDAGEMQDAAADDYDKETTETDEAVMEQDAGHDRKRYRKIPVYKYVFFFIVILLLGALAFLVVKYYTCDLFDAVKTTEERANDDYAYHQVLISEDTTSLFGRSEAPEDTGNVSPEKNGSSDDGILARHVLKQGESIVSLARRYYGDGDLWTVIVDHNRGKFRNPDVIPPGVVIEIPDIKNRKK